MEMEMLARFWIDVSERASGDDVGGLMVVYMQYFTYNKMQSIIHGKVRWYKRFGH